MPGQSEYTIRLHHADGTVKWHKPQEGGISPESILDSERPIDPFADLIRIEGVDGVRWFHEEEDGSLSRTFRTTEQVLADAGHTTAETIESPVKEVVPSDTLPKVVIAEEVTIITEEPVDTTPTHTEQWEAVREGQAESVETKPRTVLDAFLLTQDDANRLLLWAREEADGENAGGIAKALGVPVEELPDALQALSDDINPSQLRTMNVVHAYWNLLSALEEQPPLVEDFSLNASFDERNKQLVEGLRTFLKNMYTDIHIEEFIHRALNPKNREEVFDALNDARDERGTTDYYLVKDLLADLNLSMAPQLDALAELRAQVQDQTQEPTRRTIAA